MGEQFLRRSALTAALVAGSAFVGGGAQAQKFKIQSLFDMRLRYEGVKQASLPRDADALTFRLRSGAELSSGPWRLLAEGEGTQPLVEKYDNGLNGKMSRPMVADPVNLELNRLQLQYRGLPKTIITAGRQRINLEDQRFVGNMGWRQNEQTFDAVRVEYGDEKGLKVDGVYSWSVRTVWGNDGRLARQRAVDGDYLFATIGHPTPIGTVSAFAYVISQKEPVVSFYRQSSKTFGARLAGARPLSKSAKLTYALSYAAQSDHARNPNDHKADYLLTEAGLDTGPWKFGIAREVLGADGGAPFTSFQTPLATLHKFNGWADKFLTTPPNGLRDLYGNAGYGWKKRFGFDTITGSLAYHRYESDRLDLHYGNEWNALLTAKKGRWTVLAKFADYDAASFATDTRKAWLQLEWAY